MDPSRLVKSAVTAIVAALLFIGCDGRRLDDGIREAGVSLALAEARRAAISDVSYEITLSVPEDRDSAITGHETISFISSSKWEMPLDFSPAENEHLFLKVKKGRNTFNLDFVSDDRYLNWNKEYLYSLFVPAHARSVFPCFDQPDIKARFTLSLELPEGWTAVSNTAATDTVALEGGRRMVTFARTEPLSTYLFAFAAGIWSKATSSVSGREMTVLYRETDPDKTGQIPEIFNEVGKALGWMDD